MDENGKLILHIYPVHSSDTSLSARGLLYSDAGDGYGSYRLDHFHLNRAQDSCELVHISDGDYPFPPNGITLNLHGYHATQAWVDDVNMDVKDNRVDVGDFKQVRFAIT
jgi:alpha-glucosidase